MNRRHWLTLACALALTVGATWGGRADAGFRQYYSSWHAGPARYHFHYRSFYYQPNAHDYVIYYPQQPRYLYYYNPVARTYWGRFDVKTKGYSLLAEEDRKGALKDIPESKFPDPGDLPNVHGDKVADKVDVPPTDDLPIDLPTGEDLSAKTDPKTDPKTDTKTDTKADADQKPGPTPSTVSKPQPATGGEEPAPRPDPKPEPKPKLGDGDTAPPPAPKPGVGEGDTAPPPAPKPGPGGGDTAPPAPRPQRPAARPAPQPDDLPAFQLPPGYSCESHRPKQ